MNNKTKKKLKIITNNVAVLSCPLAVVEYELWHLSRLSTASRSLDNHDGIGVYHVDYLLFLGQYCQIWIWPVIKLE